MTEERMIRVVRKDFVRGGVDDGELIPYMLSYIKWNDLEPAPPKDFSPKCARIDELNEIKGVVAPLVCSCLLWNECPFKRIKR